MIPNYNDTTLLGMMIQTKRKSFALYDDRGKLKEKQFDITKKTSLANKIGCSVQKITDFETGKKLPSKEELKNIAVYFDISIDYFIFGSLENYIKNIFTVTIYDRNQNEDSRLTISLNNVKKLALLFEASMDTTYSTRYPKYLDVLNLAVEWKIIPFIDDSYNLIDITQKYGNDIWLLIAEQLYYNNFISNKNKYILLKKETNRLIQNALNNDQTAVITFLYNRLIIFNDIYRENISTKLMPMESVYAFIGLTLQDFEHKILSNTFVDLSIQTDLFKLIKKINKINPYDNPFGHHNYDGFEKLKHDYITLAIEYNKYDITPSFFVTSMLQNSTKLEIFHNKYS